MSLEEFLRLPEEKPYLEYIDGRIEAKVSPQKKHVVLQAELLNHLNQFARPRKLGRAFLELRCTFGGRSIVPDLVFLLNEHLEIDEEGEYVDETLVPPDIHVEIISPRQSPRKAERNLTFSLGQGCRLGWLIDPYKKTGTIHLPDAEPRPFGREGFLDGGDVLPGYRLGAAELFGWLKA